MSHLYVTSSRQQGRLRVALIGPLDRQTSTAFHDGVSKMLGERGTVPAGVVVNLRCCTAMDADGALALDRIRDSVAARGASFDLEDVPPLLDAVMHRAAAAAGTTR